MIDQFWIAVGIIIAAASALFGGYWKLMNAGTNVHNRFLTDLKSMEATIRSSKLIPHIVGLYDELRRDQINSPNTDVKEILSQEKYAQKIKSITVVENEISDVRVLYSQLKNSSFAIGRSLLYLGIVLLVAIPYLYLYGTGLAQLDQYGGPLLAYSIAIMVVRVIPQISRHDRTRVNFVNRYDEIMIGL